MKCEALCLVLSSSSSYGRPISRLLSTPPRFLSTLAEEAYHAAKKNVDKHAQLRDKYFKEAEEAYAAGDKDKARELRGTTRTWRVRVCVSFTKCSLSPPNREGQGRDREDGGGPGQGRQGGVR